MNNFKKTVISLLAVAAVCSAAAGIAACKSGSDKWTVTSPDKSISAKLAVEDGSLLYTVTKGETTVVEKSKLGFTFEECAFDYSALLSSSADRITGSYENISGKSSKVEYDCNQTVYSFGGENGFVLDVTVRVYDDGYAFKYGVHKSGDESGTLTVKSEDTHFTLPEKSALWVQEYRSDSNVPGETTFAYEEVYNRMGMSYLQGKYYAMPLLYQAGMSDTYSLITESHLIGSGFYGSFLTEDADNPGVGSLGFVHNQATVKSLEECPDNEISYPFNSPWRLGIVGDFATITESELVEKLYDDVGYWKPDNYDELSESEKEIYDYDWVETGASSWSWLIENSGFSWNNQDKFLQIAADMGWKYVTLDGGWSTNLNENTIKDFTAKAHGLGVKVVVWANSLASFKNGNAFGDYGALCERLDEWKSYGIDGIKVDFFDGMFNKAQNEFQGEDIKMIKWYETIYQETAKRKMVVSCHGANKPTGERRVYPNVINREAVAGNELYKSTSRASYTVKYMFTRAVVGPTDYTPVVIPMNDGFTVGSQMALAVLYESGMPTLGDTYSVYRREDISDFFKNLPALRDETKYLCGSPDSYYCGAMRSGDVWYVGGINGVIENSARVDFSFLGDGVYVAEIYTDKAGDAKSVEKRVEYVTKASVKTFDMGKDGGFVIKLTKQD